MHCSSCTAHCTSCTCTAHHARTHLHISKKADRRNEKADSYNDISKKPKGRKHLHEVLLGDGARGERVTKVRHIFSECRLATKSFPPEEEDKSHPAPSMIFANKAPRDSTRVRNQCNLSFRISKQCIRAKTMEMQNDRNQTS